MRFVHHLVARRPRNELDRPATTSALLTAIVTWNLGGFATGFFPRAWGEAPLPVLPISYSLNAAIVVVLPFTRDDRPEAAMASSALGGLMAAWSAAGVLNTPREVRLGPLPGVFGAGVPMVLGALACLSGYRRARVHDKRRWRGR